jgi:hypothetical protein
VQQNTCRQREDEVVDDGVHRGEVGWGVLIVCSDVEGVVWVEHALDIVRFSEVVVWPVGRDGEVRKLSGLCGGR